MAKCPEKSCGIRTIFCRSNFAVEAIRLFVKKKHPDYYKACKTVAKRVMKKLEGK
jgi:hypothetical protein